MSPARLLRYRIHPAKADVLSAAVLNIAIGAGDLLLATHRTSGPAFQPARELLDFLPYDPMRCMGALLLALGLGFLIGALADNEALYRITGAGLSAYWLWWAGLFIAGVGAGGSLRGPVFAFFWAIRQMRLPAVSPWRR